MELSCYRFTSYTAFGCLTTPCLGVSRSRDILADSTPKVCTVPDGYVTFVILLDFDRFLLST